MLELPLLSNTHRLEGKSSLVPRTAPFSVTQIENGVGLLTRLRQGWSPAVPLLYVSHIRFCSPKIVLHEFHIVLLQKLMFQKKKKKKKYFVVWVAMELMSLSCFQDTPVRSPGAEPGSIGVLPLLYGRLGLPLVLLPGTASLIPVFRSPFFNPILCSWFQAVPLTLEQYPNVHVVFCVITIFTWLMFAWARLANPGYIHPSKETYEEAVKMVCKYTSLISTSILFYNIIRKLCGCVATSKLLLLPVQKVGFFICTCRKKVCFLFSMPQLFSKKKKKKKLCGKVWVQD